MATDSWQVFAIPELGLQFRHPAMTPQGAPVVMDEFRVHFRSEQSEELYFEVSRHWKLSVQEAYERERSFGLKQFGPGAVSELMEITFAGQAAFTFSIQWDGEERTVALIEKGKMLYRVLYDPRSPLNTKILSTLVFE